MALGNEGYKFRKNIGIVKTAQNLVNHIAMLSS